jgi:hypothetical protein
MEKASKLSPDQNTQAKIDRRRLLRTVTSFTLTTALTAGPKARENIGERLFQSAVRDEIRQREAWLDGNYGLRFDFGPVTAKESHHKIDGMQLSLVERMDLLGWTKAEVVKYPPDFISDLFRSTSVRVLKGISVDTHLPNTVGGLTMQTQQGSRVYLSLLSGNPDLFLSGLDPFLVKASLHHEFHHAADIRDGSSVDNPEWAAINPAGDQAYNKNRSEQVSGFSLPFTNPPGFANNYGQTDEDEDQATVAEWMLNYYNQISEKAIGDAVLSRKIVEIKNRYAVWTNGRMDEQYWADLSNNKVDIKYWSSR